jgi:hypothetical protein
MPDGKRSRRHSANKAKRLWYAHYRSLRFHRRFGLVEIDIVQILIAA